MGLDPVASGRHEDAQIGGTSGVELVDGKSFLVVDADERHVAPRIRHADLESLAQLTPELLQTGKWRDAKLRPYDVDADALTL